MTALVTLSPDWPAPARVAALQTTRGGGVSAAPYASLNLADHVGDSPQAVVRNRQRLQETLDDGVQLQLLQQVHGSTALEVKSAGEPLQADALITRVPGVACCVMTADCLPVFLASRAGDEVALAHAGWRGLAEGILENTVARMKTPPGELLAWLGPAIGPCHFEVGPEVRERFLANPGSDAVSVAACFQPVGTSGKYLADLAGIARGKLEGLGIAATGVSGLCTVCDAQRFFSYRRDGTTGRMLSLIYLRE